METQKVNLEKKGITCRGGRTEVPSRDQGRAGLGCPEARNHLELKRFPESCSKEQNCEVQVSPVPIKLLLLIWLLVPCLRNRT